MLIVINDKESVIIDNDNMVSYCEDIISRLPSYKKCLREINKSALTDEFIGELMCIAYDNNQNAKVTSLINKIVDDLLKTSAKKVIYPETLPLSVKTSINERIDKIKSELESSKKIISDAAKTVSDQIMIEYAQVLHQVYGIDIDEADDVDILQKVLHDVTMKLMGKRKDMCDIDKMTTELSQLTYILDTQEFEG